MVIVVVRSHSTNSGTETGIPAQFCLLSWDSQPNALTGAADTPAHQNRGPFSWINGRFKERCASLNSHVDIDAYGGRLHAINRAQENILKKKKKYMEGGEEK